MMKIYIKFYLTILAGIVTTACSSGGSDDGKSDKSKIEIPKVEISQAESKAESPKVKAPGEKEPKVEAPKVEVPKEKKPLVNDAKTGAIYITDRNGFIRKEDFAADNLKAIVIDGEEIEIGKDIDKIWTEIHQNSESLVLGFRLLDDNSAYFFYNGKPTSEMPMSGTAVYKGDYFVKGAKPFQNGPVEQFGTSLIKVNFADKTLSADLVETITNSKIKIDGKIAENSFSGRAISERFINTVEVDGRFYGENAAEVGGILTDKKQLIGIFSGKK